MLCRLYHLRNISKAFNKQAEEKINKNPDKSIARYLFSVKSAQRRYLLKYVLMSRTAWNGDVRRSENRHVRQKKVQQGWKWNGQKETARHSEVLSMFHEAFSCFKFSLEAWPPHTDSERQRSVLKLSVVAATFSDALGFFFFIYLFFFLFFSHFCVICEILHHFTSLGLKLLF